MNYIPIYFCGRTEFFWALPMSTRKSISKQIERARRVVAEARVARQDYACLSKQLARIRKAFARSKPPTSQQSEHSRESA